jgi:hypothetical protein
MGVRMVVVNIMCTEKRIQEEVGREARKEGCTGKYEKRKLEE